MDGSMTLFYARLNSGVMWKLKGLDLHAGATLEIVDHEFLWLWEDELMEWKAVMLIKEFKHK